MKPDKFVSEALTSPVVSRHLRTYSHVVSYHCLCEVEDARQDLLLEMLKNAKKFDPERGELSWFAYRILYNTTQNLIRTSKGKKKVYLRTVALFGEWPVNEDPDTRLQIEEFAATCSLRDRTIMRLIGQGFTYKECAKRLGVSKQRIDQIVQRLRRKATS